MYTVYNCTFTCKHINKPISDMLYGQEFFKKINILRSTSDLPNTSSNVDENGILQGQWEHELLCNLSVGWDASSTGTMCGLRGAAERLEVLQCCLLVSLKCRAPPREQREHSTRGAVPGWRWPVTHSSSPAPGWSCSEGYCSTRLWAKGRALWSNEDHWSTGKATGRASAAPWGDGQTVQWSENTNRAKWHHVIYLLFSSS